MKLKIGLGCLIIIGIVVGYYIGVEEIKKIPVDFELLLEQEGQDRVLESIGGDLSKSFLIRETLSQRVVSVDDNVLEIASRVVGWDSASNEIIFDNSQTFFVDRNTRKHADTEEYFTFPPNVQKKDYEFFHPMVFAKATFVFDGTSRIGELEVYDFSCNYSGVDVSSSFPQFPSSTILSDGTCTVSVEPVTGLLVSFSKEWDDYFVNDGIRGEQVEIGGKQTTQYSKSILAEKAQSTKYLYYFFDTILPILIIIISGIVLVLIILFEKIKKQTKLIIESQNERIRQEKLSTIGELTSRISHDLRNPLSVLKIAVENIELRTEKNLDPKLDEYVPVLKDSVSRINHQINQVLGFVKTVPLELKLVSLSNVLHESIQSTTIPENISIILPENDLSLMGDRIQLGVAFSNLLSNAVDAIGENDGKIIIRARTENDDLILEIQDSGGGIPHEHIDKIFDPLFTTKQRGTGLGLASVKSIIESHGGTISVKSPPTIFTIIIPLNKK